MIRLNRGGKSDRLLGDIESGTQDLVLNQMSKVVDDYYNAVDHGVTCKKPKLK